MKFRFIVVGLLSAVSSWAGAPAAPSAPAAPAAPAAKAAAPSSAALKAEIAMWLKDAESKLTQLAEATPEAKYKWKPSKDARTTGDVFMHVVSANYALPSMAGVKPPEGYDMMTYEKKFTKKADIQKALTDSFASALAGLEAMPDADLEKAVDFYGTKTTQRGMYLLVLAHDNEHLGQSIAYARSNNIVPPWTAKQHEAAKATKEKAAK